MRYSTLWVSYVRPLAGYDGCCCVVERLWEGEGLRVAVGGAEELERMREGEEEGGKEGGREGGREGGKEGG